MKIIVAIMIAYFIAWLGFGLAAVVAIWKERK